MGGDRLTAGSLQHTVRRGETLSDIARHYGVSVAALRRWSGIEGDRILVGQKLTVRKEASAEWYVVRRGDNLTTIAARHGISPGELRRINKLDGAVIQPGQKLRLRPASSATYLVRRGDTLSEIAAAEGVPVRELRELNNLRGDRIGAGQRLRLRAGESSSGEVTEYVVRRGDSLSKIARRFDIGVSFLKQINGLKSDRIRPGQKLRLRASAVEEGIHIVRRGENLIGIGPPLRHRPRRPHGAQRYRGGPHTGRPEAAPARHPVGAAHRRARRRPVGDRARLLDERGGAEEAERADVEPHLPGPGTRSQPGKIEAPGHLHRDRGRQPHRDRPPAPDERGGAEAAQQPEKLGHPPGAEAQCQAAHGPQGTAGARRRRLGRSAGGAEGRAPHPGRQRAVLHPAAAGGPATGPRVLRGPSGVAAEDLPAGAQAVEAVRGRRRPRRAPEQQARGLAHRPRSRARGPRSRGGGAHHRRQRAEAVRRRGRVRLRHRPARLRAAAPARERRLR